MDSKSCVLRFFLAKLQQTGNILAMVLRYEIDVREIYVAYRFITFICFIFYYVMPFLTFCLFVTSLFLSLPPILLVVILVGVYSSALAFLSSFLYSVIFLTLDESVGAKKELYVCNCNLS